MALKQKSCNKTSERLYNTVQMSIQTLTNQKVSLCGHFLPVCWIDGEFRIFSVHHFMFIGKGCLGDRRVWATSTHQVILPENGKYSKNLQLS